MSLKEEITNTMEGKLDTLLAELRQSQDEIHQLRREVEEKLDAFIAKVKREVNVAQEKTSEDVTRKIGNTSYQF